MISKSEITILDTVEVGLKCLSARFVIDIHSHASGVAFGDQSLKCLSARFVIDIKKETRNEDMD